MAVSTRRAEAVAFSCDDCGAASPKWQGRCPACGAWNSLSEASPPRHRSAGAPAVRRRLDEIGAISARRRPTGVAELDRVLGGGLVDGALILLGGDPGIGKSTLALQVADAVGTAERPALYCAGEESPGQLALRATRLGCAGSGLEVAGETDLDRCLAAIDAARPPLAIVDSVQTLEVSGAAGHAGSPAQVREAVVRLMACAKETLVPVVLIGHVTKEGAIAGPRTLEHMVDVVLYLEGDRHGEHRLLRGIKNRFGATGELGIFRMAERGMEGVGAAGRAFLDDSSLDVPGNVLTVLCEGSRALVVEAQALTAEPAAEAYPRRSVNGLDINRLHMLTAVLQQRGGIAVARRDVYINCVGGARVTEPAADLAILMAIAGAERKARPAERCVVLGEVGLGGEVRRVRSIEARLAEAATLGIGTAVIPAASSVDVPSGMRVIKVATVREALALMR